MTPSELELKFKSIGKLAADKVAQIQRAVFLDISKRVIDMTPVDTGRARSGWVGDVDKFTVDTNAIESNLSPEAATAKAMDSALKATASHKTGQDLTLGNSVEYIQYLNSGSSKQAPAGMTDVVLNSFKSVVEVRAK